MGTGKSETPGPTPKPLGLLGRDEMNLAEFPITLLTDRVPKDQTEAVYQDEIYDERSGLTLTRRLTISAGGRGLTTAVDDEVVLALIQLTKLKTNFTNRRVDFSRHELIRLLGWYDSGASYERITTSLDRWTSVYLKYENAWRDNRTKTWRSAGFHIIDKYELNDSRGAGDQADAVPSYIVWGEDIFESFQAGYLKPLDYDLCVGLGNSTAKRMYRFLDKRFHHKPDWTFGLKEFAQEHVGLGRNYDGPAHLRRRLRPAVEDLERVGFLEPLPEAERFPRPGGVWSVRFRRGPAAAAAPPPEAAPDAAGPGVPPAVGLLTDRGVSAKTASDLAARHPAGAVARKVEVLDWLVGRKDKRVAKSPSGYLVKSIEEGYADPEGFVPGGERLRPEGARAAEASGAAEEARARRRLRESERAKDGRDAAYWGSLTPGERAALQAEADAGAEPSELAREEGPLGKVGRRVRLNAYLRAKLDAGEGGGPG